MHIVKYTCILSPICDMLRYKYVVCWEKKAQQGKMINNFKNSSVLFSLKMAHLYRNMPQILVHP